MKRVIAVLAVLSAALMMATPALAVPTLTATANHLGGGLVVYSVSVNNDTLGSPGGNNVAVQLTVTPDQFPATQINQVPSAIFGDIDVLSDADTANPLAFDALYFGQKGNDSWWEDNVFDTPNLPFGGVQGGAVGSQFFQYSAGTTSLPGLASNVTFLGQIAILDMAAAGLPVGPLTVVPQGGAQWNVVDPLPLDPNTASLIAASNATFLNNQTFAIVIPEPSTLALLGIGLIALGAFFRRR